MTFDPDAVTRAQSGDDAAREALLSAVERPIRGFFRSRIGAAPEVDDLVQNALVRVHRGLDALNNPARFKAFAMKAALFELQDFYRGRYSSREALFDPDLPTPGSVGAEDVGLKLDLEGALAALTDHARTILEMRELGYPYAEIAETLDTTEAAVKMQVKRAFEKLRGLLADGSAVAVGLAVLAALHAAL
ncbi:RNA polymerase sigma factor [Rubrivirga marina]|uniref:RNA polymerase subunit sigma-24 n=1 Tax=Rubrivirga marina TaxID=1196024 RepID=A0A271J211_9BACT|nr:sigma-70 family RNA polymerase sigma factor [Rubrivirga marina]PAP77532.1 RNA polymerase subunit sigma-24 [Rubrivirga marina]